MVCPSCEHVYPIRDGIPNMVSFFDEAWSLAFMLFVLQLLAEHEIKR